MRHQKGNQKCMFLPSVAKRCMEDQNFWGCFELSVKPLKNTKRPVLVNMGPLTSTTTTSAATPPPGRSLLGVPHLPLLGGKGRRGRGREGGGGERLGRDGHRLWLRGFGVFSLNIFWLLLQSSSSWMTVTSSFQSGLFCGDVVVRRIFLWTSQV